MFKAVAPNEHATVRISVCLMDNNSIFGWDVITPIQKDLSVYVSDDKLSFSHWRAHFFQTLCAPYTMPENLICLYRDAVIKISVW